MGLLSHQDSARVTEIARAVGFDAAGVGPVALPAEAAHLQEWLDAGYAGSMAWLSRNPEVRLDLRERFPWAQSVVVVMRSYRPADSDSVDGLGRYVSSYARGVDYHDVLLPRLHDLASSLVDEFGEFESHAYVDTGPTMERLLAASAGLGWQAKNTLLLSSEFGSRFFLGMLVTSLELPVTSAAVASCGNCTSCQSACPTSSFVSPGVLDARRCISYLTIEHRGAIDRSLRPAMGQWLFGCDLCQTCCPFETHVPTAGDVLLRADGSLDEIDLPELLTLDDDAFRARFRKTPLWRPRREGLLRNALIVAGNGEHADCVPAALQLLTDPSPVLREAASWCLGRLRVGADELRTARSDETESWVRDAIDEDLALLGQ